MAAGWDRTGIQEIKKNKIEIGAIEQKCHGFYYVQSGDYYYGAFVGSKVLKDADGNYILKKDCENDGLAYDSKGHLVIAYMKLYRTIDNLTTGEVEKALNQYMPAYGYESYDDYILDYYKKPDGSRYESVSELLRNDENALNDLSKYKDMEMPGDDNKVESDPALRYDKFYQNIMGFQVGDAEDMDALLGNIDHGHGHGEWVSNDPSLSIGSYMTDKLDET